MPEPEIQNEAATEAAKEKESSKKVPRNRILCRITCMDKNFLTAEMPVSLSKFLPSFFHLELSFELNEPLEDLS